MDVFRWKYGGLTKVDPAKYPENKKSHMRFGDFKHWSVLYAIMGAMGLIGCFWFPWYEDPAYYVEAYGSDTFYTTVMTVVYVTTVIFIAGAIIMKILDGREKKKNR